jgi:hypothetical protein
MLVSLLERIEGIGVFSQIRGSAYAYPVLLWLHLIAVFVWGGLMLVADLRLLGVGGGREAAADTIAAYRRSKRISFLLAALCGALLFAAKAGQYTYNFWFWIKLLLLVLLGANYLILRRSLAANGACGPGRRKLAAVLSLVLWMGAVGAARGPATIKDLMHAMIDPSAEFLFDSVQIIGDRQGIREIAPQTAADWDRVRTRAGVLLKAPDLLTTPSRRVARPRDRAANPEAELETAEIQTAIEANRQDFALRAEKLREAASVVMRAVEAKDKDALFIALNDIDRACEGCHVRYWYPKDRQAVEAAREAGILP